MVELGLSKKWIDKMVSFPESGMGYQKVEVKLKSGVRLKGIVMNSDILKVDGHTIFGNEDIEDIKIL